MSDIRGPKSECLKPHHAGTLCALYRTSDLRTLMSAESGSESGRGLCRAVACCEGRLLPRRSLGAGGFTLLELVIVIGVIAILFVLIAPAFTTMTSGTGIASAVYGVQGV